MHIHILGICGTFMGSLAILAKEMGFKVTGCDQGVYPPMSTQLESFGVELISGYSPDQIELDADVYVIGNAISRGNPLLEEILNQGLNYTSGPAFLAQHILPGKWVLGVSGTHGKTTTSSMLAWILEYAGMSPGFLIGGVPENFNCSARLGDTPFFVIEADEYDSAFFDKRSKFVHYRPRTFIINNLEFDHADIFADLEAIKTQFHHVVRTIPQNGRIVMPEGIAAIDEVIDQGCWSDTQTFNSVDNKLENEGNVVWSASGDNSGAFDVTLRPVDGTESETVSVNWELTGEHNIQNGVAAMLAARHVGVTLEHSAAALSEFSGVKRRMQRLADYKGVTVYDDFAHHPTAIKTTLEGLRKKVGEDKIIALIEPRSNTMKMGVHAETLLLSANAADAVVWASLGGLDWLDEKVEEAKNEKHQVFSDIESLVNETLAQVEGDTHIVIMSNGGFGGVHQKLINALKREEL